MKHVHADNMALYAQDAMVSDTPWEFWEYWGGLHREWLQLQTHPAWDSKSNYRRVVPMSSIGGHKYPKAATTKLSNGDRYYYPFITNEDLFGSHIWYCDILDRANLKRGVVHLTKEAAIQHAKALILASGGSL